MWLVANKAEAAKVASMGLEEFLTYLIRYGKPRLSYFDKGWYCKVEMNTNTKGTQFDVASDFDQPTPLQAVRMCNERIENAMKALGI